MPVPSNADLRAMSPDELARAGDQALRAHLLAQAVVAHHKHAPLTARALEALLQDPECLRHPVRLVFEFGAMAMHQFAQPDLDWRDPEQRGRVLCLRPLLRGRPDLTALAVAYMIPVLNYGDIITDDHCLLYGATLLGLTEAEFYQQLCDLSRFVGAEELPRGSTSPS
jgi:hypothetical protein